MYLAVMLICNFNEMLMCELMQWKLEGGGGGVLPYMSCIGMCRCEGYGFQQVYSRIGYRNQRVLV